MGMTRPELEKMIRDVAGAAVADAFSAIEERRKAKAVQDGGHALALIEGERLTPGSAADQKALRLEQRGLIFGGFCAALARAKMDLGKAAEIAERDWKQPEIAKALSAGTATDGGVLIAPEHSEEIIDLLAARTVVRRHVADSVDVSAGQIDMPRMTADASSTWGGEIDAIAEGQPAFDQLIMRAFQHKILVPVSNTLLRRGGARVNALIRNSTLRSMALGEDQVLLRSPGTEHRPKGLLYHAPTTSKFNAAAWSGTDAEKLAKVTADLGKAILKQEELNVPGTGNFWIFAPRTKQYLMSVRDASGNFVYRPEMLQGKLWGWAFETTTHVPTNLGTGSDESEVYLVDGDELMIGQGAQLQVSLSEEGTYVDNAGKVISAFQRNMTLLRIINEVDLKPKHAEAIVVVQKVKWQP